MAKKFITVPSISRVAPNSTAIVELPINPTYQNLTFVGTGTGLTAAMFGAVRVMVDGDEYQKFNSLQDLFDINYFYGRSVDTVNEWMIHFKRDEFDTLALDRSTAFGTADLRTFTVEIDILGTAPANVTLSAQAYIDPERQNLLVYNKVRVVPFSSASAGEVEFDKLMKNGAVYNAMHFFKADVNRVALEVDQNKVIDATKAMLERQARQVRPNARVPVTAKATHLDFLTQGDAGDLFDTAKVSDLRLRLTLGTSGSFNIYTEEIATHIPKNR